MAWSEVTVDVIGNPASSTGQKGKKRKMAKKLSDKQIKFFGTARQKAALKARRSKLRTKANKAKSHRPRTKPKSKSSRPKRQNPAPELLALTLGNPSTRKRASKPKGVKKVAKSKKTSSSHRKRNTGGGKKKGFRRPMRRNPAGLGSPMDWITGGAGVLAGVVGTRAVPQLILNDKNVGPMGYFANGLTAAGLGWLTYIFFPRNKVLIGGVVAGGFAAMLARIIGDNTTYGKYLSLTGVGDYMVSNAVAPQRLVNPGSAMVEVPTGWGSAPPMLAMASSGVPADAMGVGVDLGRRAGVC